MSEPEPPADISGIAMRPIGYAPWQRALLIGIWTLAFGSAITVFLLWAF